MHFFYLDETGCNGRDLTQTQQPIFVLGGLIVRDEGWNKTHSDFEDILTKYFGGTLPGNFEFHTADLFSEAGSGHFAGHSRENRNKLLNDLLDLIAERKHHFYYYAVDKARLNTYDTEVIKDKSYFDLKTPYTVAYDYLITAYEHYTKEKLGKSARAMFIIDKKDIFNTELEKITRYRRFETAKTKRIKWVVEFSYAVDSEKNTMIQISDMLLFLTRKFLEIENGYKDSLPVDVKNIFRDFYRKINARLIFKKVFIEESKKTNEYNKFIQEISSMPTTRWNTKTY